MVASIKVMMFWDVTPYSLEDRRSVYLLQKMNVHVHQGTCVLNADQPWNGHCLLWNCGRLKCSLVLILTYMFSFQSHLLPPEISYK
jgi:hypothetical protein